MSDNVALSAYRPCNHITYWPDVMAALINITVSECRTREVQGQLGEQANERTTA